MHFRITGLPAGRFLELAGLSDEALRAQGVHRRVVDVQPGFPDRIALRDAEPGERVLLLNYVHQPSGPYRASHAIFVVEEEADTFDAVDTVPDVLRRRVLSLRAFDASDMIVDAGLVDGREVEGQIERLLLQPTVRYVHAHYAKYGCYAARIDRSS